MKLFFKNLNEAIDFSKTFSFGRAEGDMTFPDDDVVSTRHGKFIIEDGKAFILDTGSTNGTFLNREQLEKSVRTLLNEGDIIQFGEQIVVFSTSDNFNPDAFEDDQKSKKTKELLGQVKKKKEQKLAETEAKYNVVKSQLDKFENDLKSISEKIEMANSALAEIAKREGEFSKELQTLETGKEAMRKNIEDRKKPLYSKKGTYLDKIKLLDLAQAPEEQKTPFQNELKDIEEQILKLENEKQAIPLKISNLQKKLETLANKKAEYLPQKEKLVAALAERQLKYAPDISRLKQELQVVEAPYLKAKEELSKS